MTRKTSSEAPLYEKGGLRVQDYGNPLFESLVYEFDSHLSLAQRKSIKANPHGYISFEAKGVNYKGFILEADLNGAKNKGHFKLIKKF